MSNSGYKTKTTTKPPNQAKMSIALHINLKVYNVVDSTVMCFYQTQNPPQCWFETFPLYQPLYQSTPRTLRYCSIP